MTDHIINNNFFNQIPVKVTRLSGYVIDESCYPLTKVFLVVLSTFLCLFKSN